MSLQEARALPQAAADAIDALAHLVIFANASGHAAFAGAALASLEGLIDAPEARQIIPTEYFDAVRATAEAE